MAKIQINNLNCEMKIIGLDEQQASNILGGASSSWHIYHNEKGEVIGREWENDSKDTIEHHYPDVA